MHPMQSAGYGQSAGYTAAAQSTLQPGLVSEGDRLIDRLRELYGRIDNLAGVLNGVSLREAAVPAATAAPEHNNVRRNMERAHGFVDGMEKALSEIESRL